MQQEILRIRDQYLRATSGACWPCDNLDDVLASVPAELSEKRLLPQGKTIHELVRHLIYTEQVVMKRLRGQTVPWDVEAAWVNPAAQGLSWVDSLRELKELRASFLEVLDQVQDEQLDEDLSLEHSSAYVHLHGHIQHMLYHLGQISMLRSLLQASQ